MKICAVYWPEGGAASPYSMLIYWPENVIDLLGKWRPTCVMRHARGQKLQSFRRKWPFRMVLSSVVLLRTTSLVRHVIRTKVDQ